MARPRGKCSKCKRPSLGLYSKTRQCVTCYRRSLGVVWSSAKKKFVHPRASESLGSGVGSMYDRWLVVGKRRVIGDEIVLATAPTRRAAIKARDLFREHLDAYEKITAELAVGGWTN